jgi:drug/metabolite transporter (DMT)-like permease
MTWLFLSIILDFGFIQFFKHGQRRGYYAPVVVTVNYLIVALSLAIYLIMTDAWTFPPEAVYTGLATGCVFISSMLLMNFALTIAPVGPVLTAFRMSIVVPIALGIYLWGEPMAPTQFIGLLFALLALALMTSSSQKATHVKGLKAFGLLGLVCFWQGFSHTCLRSVHYNGLDAMDLQVLLVTGTTAGLIGCGVIAFKKHRPQKPAIKLGIFIGLYNAGALCVIMTALSHLPGTIFFPTLGCSVVLLDNLFAHFYWREQLPRPAIAGVVVAVIAVLLVL